MNLRSSVRSFLREIVDSADKFEGRIGYVMYSGVLFFLAGIPALPWGTYMGELSFIFYIISAAVFLLALISVWELKSFFETEADASEVDIQTIAAAGFLVMFFVARVVSIWCVSLAAITFGVAINEGLWNPFHRAFNFWNCILFYVDQALKGAFFDVMEIFNLDVQTALSVNPRTNYWFCAFLVLFRLLVSVLVVGSLFLFVQKSIARSKSGADDREQSGR